MPQLIMADNQYVTRIGFCHIISSLFTVEPIIVHHKQSLLQALEHSPNAVIVLDYTLFDIPDIDTLLVLETKFPDSWWILFSSELSDQFVKQIYLQAKRMSVLFKDCSAEELVVAWHDILQGRRYMSSSVSQTLLNSVQQQRATHLTATEKQILAAIASGKTTKEIAQDRYVSTHTVVTHRKNIFRKIQVNNIHEATKYAVKAGLIDLVDYFI